MVFIGASAMAQLDRYIGYYEPTPTSHETLGHGLAMQDEACNVARALAHAVAELRAGRWQAVQARVTRPWPK